MLHCKELHHLLFRPTGLFPFFNLLLQTILQEVCPPPTHTPFFLCTYVQKELPRRGIQSGVEKMKTMAEVKRVGLDWGEL